MRPHQRQPLCVTLAATIALTSTAGYAQPPAAPPKYSPAVPAKITTPDTVETRIGTLRFKDGAPDPATVQLAYDQIDFNRGINAFLKGMSATSEYACCRGLEEAGVNTNGGIGMRSLLPTDQKSAGMDGNAPGLKKNADGGATVWFGPKAPAGNEANWVQTMPGRGYNLLLRLYGPLEPWFDHTWQPGDIELQ